MGLRRLCSLWELWFAGSPVCLRVILWMSLGGSFRSLARGELLGVPGGRRPTPEGGEMLPGQQGPPLPGVQLRCRRPGPESGHPHSSGPPLSEVIDISPGNHDSSLCFIQPGISHDVLYIYKQGDNILPCGTPFLI